MDSKLILIFAIVIPVGLLLSYMIDRWVNPWCAESAVSKLLKDIKDGKPKNPREYSLEISFDSTGFSVKSFKNPSEKLEPIVWSRIQRVTAFKRDLFTVDCICLFLALNEETGIEIDEDMKGWTEFLKAIPNYLPGCKPMSEWLFDVASPAFAANPTEIYARAAQTV